MAVEKVGGDADHEARVAAAFGGLELGGSDHLAAAARQSRLLRMTDMDTDEGQGELADSGGVESMEGTVASHGEASDAAPTSSTATAGTVSSQHDGFEDAYLQMGGRVEDIPTSPSSNDGAGLPSTEGLNTSWESPTAAEFRIRRASLSDQTPTTGPQQSLLC